MMVDFEDIGVAGAHWLCGPTTVLNTHGDVRCLI